MSKENEYTDLDLSALGGGDGELDSLDHDEADALNTLDDDADDVTLGELIERAAQPPTATAPIPDTPAPAVIEPQEPIVAPSDTPPAPTVEDSSHKPEAGQYHHQQPAAPVLPEALTNVDEQIDALARSFDDGELTTEEYERQRRQLYDQRDDLRHRARAQAEESARIAQDWTGACQSFVGATQRDFYTKADGTPNATRLAALDATIKSYGAQLPSGTSFDQVLAQCHARVLEELGISPAPAAPVTPPPAPTSKKPDLPPSLASAPAAETADPSASAYAALDRLKGDDAEYNLARMTPEQRDAWLRS